MRNQNQQSGFITMIVVLAVIVVAVLYVAFKQVASVQR